MCCRSLPAIATTDELLLDEDGGVIRTRAAVEFLRAQLARADRP